MCQLVNHLSIRNGFTMIELLVVLVLLGLIAAGITPSIQRIISSRSASLERQQVASKLAMLPLQASLGSQMIIVDEKSEYWQEFSPSTIVTFSHPLIVLENGFCLETTVTVQQLKRQYHYVVSSPLCELKEHDPA
jgi:prepilin-type N-terminal cleavage/methylation domain-containing protein